MKRQGFSLFFGLIFLVSWFTGNFSTAYAYSLNLVGRIRFGTGLGSDCWGYTAPDGTEYALMGVYNGVAVVKADSSMQVIGTVPGPQGASWRDIKTYRNYAYEVFGNDGNE